MLVLYGGTPAGGGLRSNGMKVIDAHTGLVVREGDRIPMPEPGRFSTPEGSRARMRRGLEDNYYQMLKIYPGIFTAHADVLMVEGGRQRFLRRQPLQVRWAHPRFFLRHVAFVPS